MYVLVDEEYKFQHDVRDRKIWGCYAISEEGNDWSKACFSTRKGLISVELPNIIFVRCVHESS